ncbi:hypothetical protein E2C01_039989 [Portunus trituberculatus]|uniref:Uncharacterized protein n=1 Tax=Portunus trituberculatus TaxID=210409 RepID=A0A5B7FLH9_PORTR|nr:hypothetical protein [Portunus trituberculatus]
MMSGRKQKPLTHVSARECDGERCDWVAGSGWEEPFRQVTRGVTRWCDAIPVPPSEMTHREQRHRHPTVS